MRTRYLLCYDVRDDGRLRRTAKVAEAFGYRLQYSVFICDLSEAERTRLEARLRRVLDLSEDRAILIDLGLPGRTTARRFRWISGQDDPYHGGQATVI
jgi:CRISPR-associated protein Cas2